VGVHSQKNPTDGLALHPVKSVAASHSKCICYWHN